MHEYTCMILLVVSNVCFYVYNFCLFKLKVISSGAFVTGHNKFDQREFIWTLHRSTSEMECQWKQISCWKWFSTQIILFTENFSCMFCMLLYFLLRGKTLCLTIQKTKSDIVSVSVFVNISFIFSYKILILIFFMKLQSSKNKCFL